MIRGIELAGLRARLHEAIAWCTPDSAGAVPLWTPELVDAAPNASGLEGRGVWRRLMDSPEEVVSELVARRAERLRGHAPAAPHPGRILLSEYDTTTSDGASRAASHGLVDADDVPAWDLWAGLLPFGAVTMPGAPDERRRPLLVWVPEALVARADAAVAVNPVEALAWLDVKDAELARALLA